MGRTCCVQKLILTFRTIYVHNVFSSCSAKIRASDKNLPVKIAFEFSQDKILSKRSSETEMCSTVVHWWWMAWMACVHSHHYLQSFHFRFSAKAIKTWPAIRSAGQCPAYFWKMRIIYLGSIHIQGVPPNLDNPFNLEFPPKQSRHDLPFGRLNNVLLPSLRSAYSAVAWKCVLFLTQHQ